MLRHLITLILLVTISAGAQTSPGGGPVNGNPSEFWTKYGGTYFAHTEELLAAFKESWQKNCHKGEPTFEDLKKLAVELSLDRFNQANKPNAKTYCKTNCLFTDRVRLAITKFNHAHHMKKYLVEIKGYSKQDAKNIVTTFKGYE